ncbi:hypothetical protein JOD28_001235 [Leuconostoc rapi]|nr:hypothetical protein [Leuconostoc rapi]
MTLFKLSLSFSSVFHIVFISYQQIIHVYNRLSTFCNSFQHYQKTPIFIVLSTKGKEKTNGIR